MEGVVDLSPLGAVEAGRGSLPGRVVRGELVAALFTPVFLISGMRVAAVFPEMTVRATGAFEAGYLFHVFPFGHRAGVVLANMNRNPLSRKNLNHSSGGLL